MNFYVIFDKRKTLLHCRYLLSLSIHYILLEEMTGAKYQLRDLYKTAPLVLLKLKYTLYYWVERYWGFSAWIQLSFKVQMSATVSY